MRRASASSPNVGGASTRNVLPNVGEVAEARRACAGRDASVRTPRRPRVGRPSGGQLTGARARLILCGKGTRAPSTPVDSR